MKNQFKMILECLKLRFRRSDFFKILFLKIVSSFMN